MPSGQPLTELTTRDVLLQVDRRLTLIEDDLRTLDQKWDQRFDTLDQKIDARTNQLRQEMHVGFDTLDQKIDAQFSTLDQKIDARTNQLRQEMNTGFVELRKEMNTKFHWTLGVVLASWISTIGTLLLK